MRGYLEGRGVGAVSQVSVLIWSEEVSMGCEVCCGYAGGLRSNPSECPCCGPERDERYEGIDGGYPMEFMPECSDLIETQELLLRQKLKRELKND